MIADVQNGPAAASSPALSEGMAEARITPEGIAEVRKRLGAYFKVPRRIEQATPDAIRRFAEATGDPNPLWTDPTYATGTRFGGIVAPPGFYHAVFASTGMRAGGLAGVHAFHSGSDWEWFQPIRANDIITATYRPVKVEEKASQFAGRIVIIHGEAYYFNQLGDTLARTVGWTIRTERQASREKGKYSSVQAARYTESELQAIYEAVQRPPMRGAIPRYWEDVQVGEELPPTVKGPLTVAEMVAWRAAVTGGYGGITGGAHGLRLRGLRKHPAFGVRDPKTGAMQTIGQVHHDDSLASGAAVPGAYDVGTQRLSWLASMLANWAGDDGWLKQMHAELRRFNLFGDTQWCGGRVTDKRMVNGEHLVDLEIWCDNQRGERTTPGNAVVALPSRTVADGGERGGR